MASRVNRSTLVCSYVSHPESMGISALEEDTIPWTPRIGEFVPAREGRVVEVEKVMRYDGIRYAFGMAYDLA